MGAVGSLKLGEVWFRASGLLGNYGLGPRERRGTSKRKCCKTPALSVPQDRMDTHACEPHVETDTPCRLSHAVVSPKLPAMRQVCWPIQTAPARALAVALALTPVYPRPGPLTMPHYTCPQKTVERSAPERVNRCFPPSPWTLCLCFPMNETISDGSSSSKTRSSSLCTAAYARPVRRRAIHGPLLGTNAVP